jgi:ribonuclease E
VLDGNRLEDFDVETSTKRQLKGNIYLAKVVRVEPSLQAAFVEYGGNRHGFLAFSEIHPDYYQIPIADRQRLIEMQAEEARREEEEAELELALGQGTDVQEPAHPVPDQQPADHQISPSAASPVGQDAEAEDWARPALPLLIAPEIVVAPDDAVDQDVVTHVEAAAEPWAIPELPPILASDAAYQEDVEPRVEPSTEVGVQEEDDADSYDANDDQIAELPPPETMGGDQDNGDDQRERRLTSRFMRSYKIQEVIRRRQILLVQVVKEERGTKGAALTTYLSLAGRFGVLMPNSPRGGGISRKITSAADRRRLKEVMAELDIPRGMGMIVRTAGANRPKPEIKRDCEYLLRLWDDIRDHTLKSVAPALIYEEASLIKRAIRDVYSRDIDEILVDGQEGWRAAHDFMRMLMPSHAKKVQLWRDGGQPLFARQQVESQLDSMLMPTVQLRSGGYLVINQAEALVAIDVNSGRSTRERNIEETALRTNLEAADEVARQLRLRDLAGLIVIDFIDMESKRHNAMVERRMKEALKNDRARIQVGHISHFGLLEMSRQRLRPSLAETSFIPCPHCGGTGHVRSTENAAIHVLRGIEDEGSKHRAAEITVYVSTPVALYLLNHKRERLREIELRYAMRVVIAADDTQIAPQYRVERVRLRTADELAAVVTPDHAVGVPAVQDVEGEEEDEEDEDLVASAEDDDVAEEDSPEPLHGEAGEAGEASGETSAEEAERRRRKRRRRRRGGKREETGAPRERPDEPEHTSAEPEVSIEEAPAPVDATREDATMDVAAECASEASASEGSEAPPPSDEDGPNRRRGRRGGRRRRRDNEGDISPFAVPGAEQPDLLPVYAGPTPANPFGGQAFDIFDVMDQVERQAETVPAARPGSAAEIDDVSAPEPSAIGIDAETRAEQADASEEPAVAPEPPYSATEILTSIALETTRDTSPSETAVGNGSQGEPAAEGAAMTESDLPDDVLSINAVPVAANGGMPEAVAPEPPPAEPAVKPILVGAGGEPPAERKRGWWRR